MGNVRTAEQRRKDTIAVMGQELGVAFDVIHNKVSYLSMYWLEYKTLFEKQSRVE